MNTGLLRFGYGILAVFCMLAVLTISAISCTSGISSEARTYLSKMQTFDRKYDELYWSTTYDVCSPAFDQLVGEIASLSPPYESISYEGRKDFYLPREHSEYVEALRRCVSAQRNLESTKAFLKSSCKRLLQDPFWKQLYVDVDDCIHQSPQLREASYLTTEAYSTLSIIRYKWDSVFRQYLRD